MLTHLFKLKLTLTLQPNPTLTFRRRWRTETATDTQTVSKTDTDPYTLPLICTSIDYVTYTCASIDNSTDLGTDVQLKQRILRVLKRIL